MANGKIYVGRRHALEAAGLLDLPELAARCHPADARPAIDAWRRDGGYVVCFSSDTLDLLEPAEACLVRCVASIDGRYYTLMPLNMHPDWHSWRTRLRVGEFWSTVGEDWTLGLLSDASPWVCRKRG